MGAVISRGAAFSIVSRAREAVCESAALQELMDDCDASSAKEAIQALYGGVTATVVQLTQGSAG